METKKKKRLYNIIMVAIIALFAIGAILIVFRTKGYVADESKSIKATKVYGLASVERNKLVMNLKEDQPLMAGDVITTKTGGRVTLAANGSNYILGDKSCAKITEVENGNVKLKLLSGYIFVKQNESNKGMVNAGRGSLEALNAFYSVSQFKGTTTFTSFNGGLAVNIEGDQNASIVEAGSCLYIYDNSTELSSLNVNRLSNFELICLMEYVDKYELCLTKEELQKVVALRQEEIKELTEGDTTWLAEATEDDKTTLDNSEATEAGTTGDKTTEDKTTEDKTTEDRTTEDKTTEDKTTEDKTTEDKTTEDKTTEDKTTEDKTTETATTEEQGPTCSIVIRCDNILYHMEDLSPAKAAYVPSNGIILGTLAVKFKQGDTAFDILKKVCSEKGIQLEYSYTPMYGSYYIEGIHNLYEFDCGVNSGWLYKVNGWLPSYGCSEYEVEDGDVIVWMYTCDYTEDTGY